MVNRIVVGAHYGTRDWLALRITAVVMAVYTLILLYVFVRNTPLSFGVWHELFTQGWMRVSTLLFAICLVWHAWVGVRDILMDYIKHDGLRLALQVCTLLLLAAYLSWSVQVLWG